MCTFSKRSITFNGLALIKGLIVKLIFKDLIFKHFNGTRVVFALLSDRIVKSTLKDGTLTYSWCTRKYSTSHKSLNSKAGNSSRFITDKIRDKIADEIPAYWASLRQLQLFSHSLYLPSGHISCSSHVIWMETAAGTQYFSLC